MAYEIIQEVNVSASSGLTPAAPNGSRLGQAVRRFLMGYPFHWNETPRPHQAPAEPDWDRQLQSASLRIRARRIL
jgi:hypothetical protein